MLQDDIQVSTQLRNFILRKPHIQRENSALSLRKNRYHYPIRVVVFFPNFQSNRSAFAVFAATY
jgi:hypothetical protein